MKLIILLCVFKVTNALKVTCSIYAVFSLLQYLCIAIGYVMAELIHTPLSLLIASIGIIIGSVGVAFRGPIYMTMPPMRQAFFRGVKTKNR